MLYLSSSRSPRQVNPLIAAVCVAALGNACGPVAIGTAVAASSGSGGGNSPSVSFDNLASTTPPEADISHFVALRLHVPGPGGLPESLDVDIGIEAAASTATPGQDFTLVSSVVNFPQGALDGTTILAQLNLQQDGLFEGNETVMLRIDGVTPVPGSGVPGTHYSITSPSLHEITIVDDDAGTWIASVSTQGSQCSQASGLLGVAISGDARFVAFDSLASDLVGGDLNGVRDAFVHDRSTHTTTIVSVSTAGVQGDLASYEPSISGDGRFVAFGSGATTLVAGDTNDHDDVFVRDTLLGQTVRVSVKSTTGNQGDGNSGLAGVAISSDGRFVVFDSAATNLVGGDTNGSVDVLVHDRQQNTTTRVSLSSAGLQGNNDSGASIGGVSISGDGRFVAFASQASNLVPGDLNLGSDVFVRDRLLNTTTIVSTSTGGSQGDNQSFFPRISADGSHVSFCSASTNLVVGDSEGDPDIFIRDLLAGVTSLASISSSGSQGNGFSWGSAPLSTDGRFIAFISAASNFSTGDVNGVPDAFVRDFQTGATVRASVDSSGVGGNGFSGNVAISADGRSVAFYSASTNFSAPDLNNFEDVFVHVQSDPLPLTGSPGNSTSWSLSPGPCPLELRAGYFQRGEEAYLRAQGIRPDSTILWFISSTPPLDTGISHRVNSRGRWHLLGSSHVGTEGNAEIRFQVGHASPPGISVSALEWTRERRLVGKGSLFRVRVY